MKREKLKPTDGLGPYEIKRLRSALRQCWHRCRARKLCVDRCTNKKDGFTYCELCKAMTPKLKVDHIKAVGEMDAGHIFRLFCPSKFLQGLCKTCHDEKTKQERKELKAKKGNEYYDENFF